MHYYIIYFLNLLTVIGHGDASNNKYILLSSADNCRASYKNIKLP